MAETVPSGGNDVSAGTYECIECSYELEVESTEHLAPVSRCL